MQVMIDIETLSTKKNAQIIQIGAVACWDIWKKPSTWREFLVSIDQTPSLPYDKDPYTVQWWSQQGEAAQASLEMNKVDNIYAALVLFNDWLADIKFEASMRYPVRDTIWANPPSFDCTILDNAYRVESVDKPWTFRQERDSRTLYHTFPGGDSLTPPYNIVKHRADHDAMKQLCGVVGLQRRQEQMNELYEAAIAVVRK